MNSSDPRFFILNLLQNYVPYDDEEKKSLKKLIYFVKTNINCFDDKNILGHVVGSAIVVDNTFSFTLLTHHVKINKWIQFGGHSSGNPNTLSVALREAVEESGLQTLHFIKEYGGIFDIDVHPIPQYKDIPLHNHYDIRILLIGDKEEKYSISDESKDLKWMKLNEVKKCNNQHSLLRLIEKVQKLKKKYLV